MHPVYITALALALLLTIAAPLAAVPDVFLPYISDEPPPVVEIIDESEVAGVHVIEMRFLSRTLPSGEQYEIHSILAHPTAPGVYPGIVVCHGGSGYAGALRDAVIGWAERGYVAIVQDAPGIAGRTQAGSRGPYFAQGGNTFTTEPDITASPLFDGMVAILNSLALLRSRPDVDTERIGILGGSWGGYSTTMIAGLAGDRIRAAFSLYGAGFYEQGTCWMPQLFAMSDEQRQLWLNTLDAGRQAHNISADYMILAANNDWFFWPPSIEATLDVMPGEKNYLFAPNDYHAIRQPGGTDGPPAFNTAKNRAYMEIRFMDWKLKGVDNPFPTAAALIDGERAEDRVRVRFTVDSQRPVTAAHLYWSAGEMPWRFRWWERVEAALVEDGVYEALVPVEQPDYPIDWVGVVTDDDYATVSTRIRRFTPLELGFTSDQRIDRLFSEDFEGPQVSRRWRWAPITPRGEGGRWAVNAEATRTGERGLMLQGVHAACAWGIRAAPLRHSGARGLRFWARSATAEPLEGLEVSLQVELERAARHQWVAAEVQQATLTEQWQQFEVPWSGFVYSGEGDPPCELLSDGLGELRFLLAESDQAVHIDDIEFF